MDLAQAEADRLLDLDKWFQGGEVLDVSPESEQQFKLKSNERGESFLFNLKRGSFLQLSRSIKTTYMTRARKVIVLARVDMHGPPHSNPDGTRVHGNHIHVYREGYADTWAYPLPDLGFTTPPDAATALREFCDFCSITSLPVVQTGLV